MAAGTYQSTGSLTAFGTSQARGTVRDASTQSNVLLKVASMKGYTISPGDTLASISRKFYGNSSSWRVLAKENGITNPSAISVGMRLYIPKDPKNPQKGKVVTMPVTVQNPVKPINRYTAPSEQPLDYDKYEWKVYQAKAGDSLSRLASTFLGDSGKKNILAQYNKLPVNVVLPENYTLLVPQKKRKAITKRYILSTQGVFR